MPINSRDKGARAEREFAALVADHLGVKMRRNLEQSRAGGHDLDGLPGWAVEVKARAEAPPAGALARMWAQTQDQARRVGARPLLAVKIDRHGWGVYLDAGDIRPDVWPTGRARVLLDPLDAFALVRALMTGGASCE